MADCLQNIIGLTDLDTDCFGAEPVGWAVDNASETGYYLSDAEFGFPLLAAIQEGKDSWDGDFFDMLKKARLKAIEAFRTDLSAKLRVHYNSKLHFSGTIGRVQASPGSSPATTYYGQRIRPVNYYRGGAFVISDVWIGISVTDAAIALDITSNDPSFTPVSETITSLAGQFNKTTLPTPVELPLHSDYVEELEYYISYTMPGGATPIRNKFFCCGSRPGWYKFVEAYGFGSDSLDFANNASHSRDAGFGLSLEGYLKCDEAQWLCSAEQIAGLQTKSLIGRTVQSNAAAILAAEVMSSSKVGKYTTWSMEDLGALYQARKEGYENNLNWLSENLPDDAMQCFECKSERRFQKRAILV